MAQKTITRTTSLTLASLVLIIYCIADLSPETIGIMQGASLLQRAAYSFFHTSLLHTFMNVWCLLSVAFVYPISVWALLMAYIIACSFPVDMLCSISPMFEFTMPTVGLSGMCFALMGRISFMVQRKLYYQSWLAFYILLGFIFPNVNGWLHLYCYLMGAVVGYLNKPLR